MNPHRARTRIGLATTMTLGILAAQAHAQGASGSLTGSRYGKLPLCFEANQGQFHPRVCFVSRGQGQTLLLTKNEAALVLRRTSDEDHRSVIRMRCLGGNPDPTLAGVAPHRGGTNYFVGRDRSQWRTGVPTYAKVRYECVYPGIDLVYYGNQGLLEYDFVVAPGRDPSQIRLAFQGTERIELDEDGNLILRTRGREVVQRRPVAYQELNGRRLIVPGRYVLHSDSTVTFRLAEYDRTRPLIIDPMIVYASYLGGSLGDGASGIAVDSDGCAYVTGFTSSYDDFPAEDDELSGGPGETDIFVAKFNEHGSELLYCTIIGGSSGEVAGGIAVDYHDCAYVAGQTRSTDFPMVRATQDTFAGGTTDGYLLKLGPDGSTLCYSTYHGGGSDGSAGCELVLDVTVDLDENAYIVGKTNSHDFPLVGAIRTEQAGCGSDGFVARFSFDGEALTVDYSTYLGGNLDDEVKAIVSDDFDAVYVTGKTLSCDFPTTPEAFEPNFCGYGNSDAFVTKLSFDGETLTLGPSTYFGHLGKDSGEGIAIGYGGTVYIVGETNSWELPLDGPLYEYGGLNDGFLVGFSPMLSYQILGTYLGGSGDDAAYDIAADFDDNLHIAGCTMSADFPTYNAIQDTHPGVGPYDEGDVTGHRAAFVAKFTPIGLDEYITFLGGLHHTNATSVAVDYWGEAYVAGVTLSEDFPVTPFAFQREHGGASTPVADYDAFVAKISPEDGYMVYEIVPLFGELTADESETGGSSTCGAMATPTMATMFLALGGLFAGRRRGC